MPIKPHDVLPYALPDLVQAGFTAAEALITVTSRAAEACAVRKGRTEVGADADLLPVMGNPLEDVAAVRDVWD